MIPGGVPSGERDILTFANEIIEQCRVSVSNRSALYRQLNLIAETGRYSSVKSLLNLMHKHLDRTAAHLFSPVELRFNLDFENRYPKYMQDRAQVVGNGVTRQWQRTSTDQVFARGVYESLKYGAAIIKQWAQDEGQDNTYKFRRKLVMPWNFGVYREDENDIDEQEALCETTTLTLAEVWRRIYHLPDAKKLFDRVKANSKKGQSGAQADSFFHQVLSTSQLNTSGLASSTRPIPGGIVSVSNDANYAIMGPTVGVDVVDMHELWVKDEKDYVTIQVIDPDILIAGKLKRTNLLIKDSKLQPYRLIQPNEVTNWFWGRSELIDLVEPQELLSMWCDDIRRLFGLQVDKILAFVGETGITDEAYAQFRMAGYMGLPQGSDIKDLTPKMPPEALPLVKWLTEEMSRIGGFPPIMTGQGEQGVRAGSHANTLMKTASPTLRDRALIVERQCEVCADLTLQIMEAKDPNFKWTNADTADQAEETKFLLAELPPDWRVTVDSHSSSPIFADENQQLIFALRKQGDVDGEYVIDNVPIPNKELAKAKLKEREAAKAAQMQQIMKLNPELAEKQMLKGITGGRR